MKQKQLFDDLLELTKQTGITVRKEKGGFKSGYCIVNDNEVIVLNRSNSIETLVSAIAKSLAQRENVDFFIKPALREIIDKEKDLLNAEKNFSLNVTE